ncbi:MAG: NAD(P)H-hydrate dehydratase [Candidatus Woesearchaeota archaeon]
MRYLTEKDVKLKLRQKTSHKGENGRVLIIGGSIDYVGCVMLAAMAAYRSGADWVQIAAPEKVAWAINCISPDIITTKFKGDYFASSSVKKLIRMSDHFDTILIGNGIGEKMKTRKFAASLCTGIKRLKVIDADAIAAVNLSRISNAIITPHKGELNQLLKTNGISKQQLRKKLGNNVILLKGRIDEIISREKVAFNKTGNEGMTVAGTGDVLAGLAAGLLAQGKNPFKASCAAAYANGRAGDMLLKEKGYGFLASELIETLPRALREIR